jgi:hemin uptake protein HemP
MPVEACSDDSVREDARQVAEASVAIQRRTVSSASLFGKGGKQIVIEHKGEQYRLRETRNGKLILTK